MGGWNATVALKSYLGQEIGSACYHLYRLIDSIGLVNSHVRRKLANLDQSKQVEQGQLAQTAALDLRSLLLSRTWNWHEKLWFFASSRSCSHLFVWAPSNRLWLSVSVVALRHHLIIIVIQLVIAIRLLEELEQRFWLGDSMGRCRGSSALVHVRRGWHLRLFVGSCKVPCLLLFVSLWDWRLNAPVHSILIVVGLIVNYEVVRSDMTSQWHKPFLLPFGQVRGATSQTIRCLRRWMVSELAEDEQFVFR